MMHPEEPMVSVCVVTYNQEKYIGKCIESILNNNSKFTYEIIIGDDASTDETSKIISEYQKKFPEKIKYIRHEKNVGVCKNIIETHKQARGRYIAHMDGDDLAQPKKIECQVTYLESRPEYSSCGHKVEIIDDTGRPTGRNFPKAESNCITKQEHVLFGMPFAFSSLMYRNGLNLQLPAEENFLDWFFVAQIIENGNSGCMPELLGAYRVTVGATTDSLKKARMKAMMMEMYSRKLLAWHDHRAAFNAVATLEILADLKNFRRIEKNLFLLWIKSFTIRSIPLWISTHKRRKSNAKDLKR